MARMHLPLGAPGGINPDLFQLQSREKTRSCCKRCCPHQWPGRARGDTALGSINGLINELMNSWNSELTDAAGPGGVDFPLQPIFLLLQVRRSCSSWISWWAAFPRDVQIIFISVFTHSSYKNQHFWGSLGASSPPGLLGCVWPCSTCAFGKSRPSPALKHPFFQAQAWL